MKKNGYLTISVRHTIAVAITNILFLIPSFFIIHFLYVTKNITSEATLNTSPVTFSNLLFFFFPVYFLSIIANTLVLSIGVSSRFKISKGLSEALGNGILAFTLMYIFVTTPFVTYADIIESGKFFFFFSFPNLEIQLRQLMSFPPTLLDFISMSFIFYFLTYLVWNSTFQKSYKIIFGKSFDGESSQFFSDGDRFIDTLKAFISAVRKQRSSIALMGIKLINEHRFIQNYGSVLYKKVIASIYQITTEIARKGETQLLHQTSTVFSLLFCDKTAAFKIVERFKSNIEIRLKEKYPDLPLELAVAIFGFDFSASTSSTISDEEISNRLVWGTIDAVSEAQDSNGEKIIFDNTL